VDVADPAVSVKNIKIGDDWNAGFLQKMSCKSGNLLKRRWRTRWFAMQGTILKYYRKRPAETTNTAGKLVGCSTLKRSFLVAGGLVHLC